MPFYAYSSFTSLKKSIDHMLGGYGQSYKINFAQGLSDARDPQTKQGGWWANGLDGESIGSALWLFSRSKITEVVLNDIGLATKAALEPLIDNKVADQIDITTNRTDNGVELKIVMFRGENTNALYDNSWELDFG